MSKVFNISWRDMGEVPTWLSFVFMPASTGDQSVNCHPVIWDAVAVRNSGSKRFFYPGKFAFGLCTHKKKDLLIEHIFRPIPDGKSRLDLTSCKDVPVWMVSKDQVADDKAVIACNMTQQAQDITFGVISHKGDYMPILFWDAVSPNKSVEVRLPLIVKVHASAEYKKNSVDYWIATSSPEWEANIETLNPEIRLQYVQGKPGLPRLLQSDVYEQPEDWDSSPLTSGY